MKDLERFELNRVSNFSGQSAGRFGVHSERLRIALNVINRTMSDPAQVANPKGFACPLCPKTFSNKYYVKQHVVVIHQVGLQPFVEQTPSLQ